MARIRTLKPEIAADRKLASVTRDARLTFLYVVSQADDDGLLRAEPRQLLGSLYPHDQDITPELLERWLGELVSIRVIRFRKTLDGMRVVQVVNWEKHQKIKNRSKPFLLTQLQEDRKEGRRRASGDSPENRPMSSGGAGGAESRVLSLESRVLSPEPGVQSPEPRALSPGKSRRSQPGEGSASNGADAPVERVLAPDIPPLEPLTPEEEAELAAKKVEAKKRFAVPAEGGARA